MSDSGVHEHGTTPMDRLGELFFLDSVTPVLRAALPAVVLLFVVSLGAWLNGLHRHFADEAVSGTPLNPLATLLANGSSPATVWPGWAATVFFLIAISRLRHGPAEPPIGRGDGSSLSVADLRSGLRAEYHAVRIALIVVTAVAAVDVARAVATLTSGSAETLSGGAMVATAAEAAGLLAAAATLGAWAWDFRDHIAQWGAL